MLHKIIIIILMVSTPCFAKDTIYSYTDEKGNKIYTTEKQSPSPPSKSEYREPIQQRDNTIRERKSILNSKKESVSPNAFGSKPHPLPPHINSMNQPDSRSFNPLIDTLIHQIAFMFAIAIMLFILWLVALIDILRSEFAGSNKLIWFLTVTFIPLIGSVLYLIIGKGQKVTHHEPPNNQELNIRTYNKPEI